MNSYAVFILFATRFPSYTSGQPLSNNLLTPTDEVRNLQGTGKWYIDSELKSCAPAVFDSKEACDAEMNHIISDGGILRDRSLNEQSGTGKWYIDSELKSCGQAAFDRKEACDEEMNHIISDGGILRDRNLNEQADSNRNLNEQTGKWFIDSVLDDGCYSCVQNVWPLHPTSGTFFDSKEACVTYLDYLKRNNDLGGRNLQEQQTESKSRALRGGHFSG